MKEGKRITNTKPDYNTPKPEIEPCPQKPIGKAYDVRAENGKIEFKVRGYGNLDKYINYLRSQGVTVTEITNNETE